jgi:2,3-bisphosphoglycerate-independent phosphoglycerate mutase
MIVPKNLPALLIVMDGLALGESGEGNAVRAARTPVLDTLLEDWPHTTLDASGLAVGLPPGQMGNSEVGHLNIGAGRVVYQELTRIDRAVEDGSLFRNEVLCEAIDAAVTSGGSVHLMGLLSDGGVHSHRSHLYALIRMAADRGARDVRIHCFLDGRDTPPQSGRNHVAALESVLTESGVGTITTLMGRYWAMDRDNRWERVERAWRAIVMADGGSAECAVAAVEASYRSGATDEFVEPVVLGAGGVSDGDAVIFFNFRPDRARELTRAFVDPTFDGFERPVRPDVRFVCLTEYDPTIPAPVAFPKCFPDNVLADVLSQNGLRQLHIAETEKYAHVTFFLNGGSEPPKRGEVRILIPSPHVATYDLKPEMSAIEVTDRLSAAIRSSEADVFIVNYANGDMVGHTGVFEAAVAAVECVDTCVGRVIDAIRQAGGVAFVTADHGNAESMIDADGSTPFTAHTTTGVPLIVVADGVKALADGGRLADVAPTLLDVIGIAPPDEWTGRSLLLY